MSSLDTQDCLQCKLVVVSRATKCVSVSASEYTASAATPDTSGSQFTHRASRSLEGVRVPSCTKHAGRYPDKRDQIRQCGLWIPTDFHVVDEVQWYYKIYISRLHCGRGWLGRSWCESGIADRSIDRRAGRCPQRNLQTFCNLHCTLRICSASGVLFCFRLRAAWNAWPRKRG
jgi:hypothetical protein